MRNFQERESESVCVRERVREREWGREREERERKREQAHPSVDRPNSPWRHREGATCTASSFRWYWSYQSCHSPSKRMGAFGANMCPGPLADQIRNQESRFGYVCQLVARDRVSASARRKKNHFCGKQNHCWCSCDPPSHLVGTTPTEHGHIFWQRCLPLAHRSPSDQPWFLPAKISLPGVISSSSACATTGNQTISSLTALVDMHFRSTLQRLAPLEGTWCCAITSYGTSSPV